MKKIIKIMMVLVLVVSLVVTFKNPIVLGAMDVVDFFGNITKINVVDAIDFLNNLYYL